jgi:hypothetical protein
VTCSLPSGEPEYRVVVTRRRIFLVEKAFITTGVVALLMLGGTGAEALTLTPGDTTCTSSQTSALKTYEVYDLISSCFSVGIPENDFSRLYKANVGGGEEGAYASSYDTAFDNTPSDPSDAKISYVGGVPIECAECYLLVKDGNHQPAQYVFQITGWNGMDAIYLKGFWPRGGAISHVAIYCVPEPATGLLLAAGLGLVAFRRRQSGSVPYERWAAEGGPRRLTT